MNKKNIVFSILVHERWDVVLDQIMNYLTLNPGCCIVLHKSQKFNNNGSGLSEQSFLDAIESIGNVYINPTSVRTGLYDLIQAHLSNFSFINNTIDFDFFVPGASNELFILPGVYDIMKEYDCGYGFEIKKDKSNWQQYSYAENDNDLKNIIQETGGDTIIGAQIEGSFYSKDLFARIAGIINRNYDHVTMGIKYAREEFYFSTIVEGFISAGETIKVLKDKPFTRIDWSRDLTLSIRLYEVRRWINNKRYYCVKRVNRSLNAAIREYIRKKYRYENALSKYVIIPQRSYLGIYFDAIKDYLTTYFSLIPRAINKLKNH